MVAKINRGVSLYGAVIYNQRKVDEATARIIAGNRMITDLTGNPHNVMQQQIDRNYSQIKADVLQIIEEEMERIKNDPELRYLIPQQEGEENND